MGVRNWWKKFIANLEKKNGQQFAGKRLDCCNLKDRRINQAQPLTTKE